MESTIVWIKGMRARVVCFFVVNLMIVLKLVSLELCYLTRASCSIYIADYTTCLQTTSPSGHFGSLLPVVPENEVTKTWPDPIRKSIVLISVKPNHIIWLDFDKSVPQILYSNLTVYAYAISLKIFFKKFSVYIVCCYLGQDIIFFPINIIKVYDGPYTSSPVLLRHFESSNKPPSIRSTGSDLFVVFYSYRFQTKDIEFFYTSVSKTFYFICWQFLKHN